MSLKNVHLSDINTVDWSPCNDNLIATGSNDTTVKIIDLRKFKSNHLVCDSQDMEQSPVVNVLRKHQSKVQTVRFCPFNERYLASSGDSLVFWDLNNVS